MRALRILRRLLPLALVAALLVAGAYVAGVVEDGPTGRPTASGTGGVETATPTVAPTPTRTPTKPPTPTTSPSTTAPPRGPAPAVLEPGDRGSGVRDVQARLKQIAWFFGDVTGVYGDLTAEAVRGFQDKRGFRVTGEIDQRTLDRLYSMTAEPTVAELHNRENQPGALDPRCRTGRVLCVDKTTQTLRWVVDGQVRETVDVRFGASSTPTREGLFHVYFKSRDHVSKLYGSSMPFAMFFSGGQAVHYSPDFASVGYAGASHGCVNVRDHDAVAALFDEVEVGDAVVVYWS